ncbi:MAG: endonuclease/exonuclease/phosphatase family protein [Eudoraea sp.]|nr:endonuclease/exonuclease/phosphatase family protein [Eudoraea sp.]NNL02019.1 endonuclease/exonuclease/phosphatase family protein [Eudoraea sp.]
MIQRNLIILMLFMFMELNLNAQDLTVVSYNIRLDVASDSLNRWDNRKDFLIGQLNFHGPDVFGIQEGLLHQLEEIKQGMPGYKYLGKGREDGLKNGEFSAIFYDSEKLELLEENTFWLSETPQLPSKGWDAAIKRVCTYGLFKVKGGAQFFWVFNTHFDHRGEEARKESVFLIMEKIQELNKQNLPVILTGDLNLEPDHPSILLLSSAMQDSHLLAGEKAFGPEGTFNGFNFSEPITRRIDYIFLSKTGFQLLKYAILSDSKDLRYPSDHFPVLAKLSITEKE